MVKLQIIPEHPPTIFDEYRKDVEQLSMLENILSLEKSDCPLLHDVTFLYLHCRPLCYCAMRMSAL